MPRFHIPSMAWNPDRLALDAGESHHAFDVLRMKAGDRATVFDGDGHEAKVELGQCGKSATPSSVAFSMISSMFFPFGIACASVMRQGSGAVFWSEILFNSVPSFVRFTSSTSASVPAPSNTVARSPAFIRSTSNA